MYEPLLILSSMQSKRSRFDNKKAGNRKMPITFLDVRNLGNFSSNLIQKKINMFVTLDMCTRDLKVMNI